MKKLSAQSKFLIGTSSFLVLSGVFCLTSGIVVAFNNKKDKNIQAPISLKQDSFTTSNLNCSSYLIETLLNRLNSKFIFDNKTTIFNNSNSLKSEDQIKNFVKEMVDNNQAIKVSFIANSKLFVFKIADFIKIKKTEADFSDFSWVSYSTNKDLINQINLSWLFKNKSYFFEKADNLKENQFSKFNILSSIKDKTIIINFILDYQQHLTFKILNVKFVEDEEYSFNESVRQSSFSNWKGNSDIFRKKGTNRGPYALVGESNFWNVQYNDWSQSITRNIFVNRLKTILNISIDRIEVNTSEDFVVKFFVPFNDSYDDIFMSVFGKNVKDLKNESQDFTTIQDIQLIFEFEPKGWFDLEPNLPLFTYELKTISINFIFRIQYSYQVIIYQNSWFQIVSALYNSSKENEWRGKSDKIVNIRTLELYDFKDISPLRKSIWFNLQNQIIENNKNQKITRKKIENTKNNN